MAIVRQIENNTTNSRPTQPPTSRQQNHRQAVGAHWRCRWFLTARFVIQILRARKAWAALGQRLNLFTGALQHLERKKGVLQHKVAPLANN